MQIYTRTGDHGTTRIIGGKSVHKDSTQVEAYGTIDELNSIIGMIVALEGTPTKLKHELMTIQHYLFDCGNDLATPENSDKYPYRTKPELITWLESRIDDYSVIPPAVESFILPGGTQLAAQLHVARTVTRRAERRIVTLHHQRSINEFVLKFINRLSDYFFAIARVSNANTGVEDVHYKRSGRVFHTNLTKDKIPK